ncbi:MAG: ATP-binding protein [Candidatus Omnitrophota bacterium]|nr:ATP-binding protein [Candidatus Omnitrophota bacterium]
MPDVFNAAEVIDMGIEKEKKRRDFYGYAAEKFKEKDMKKLFSRLRDWEETHIKKFTEIKNTMEESEVTESYEGEFASYVKATVDDLLYEQVSAEWFSENVRDALTAIRYGMGFEKDAILFFNELLKFMEPRRKEKVQTLIDEEKKHLIYLNNLKYKYEITEYKRMEKIKDDFIGTVSHELRTPLSITKEGISLVLDKIPGPINEEQARILTISKNNLDRLARIINSLLDISRIESGKIEMTCENIEITAAIRQAVALFELKTKEKGLDLRTNLPIKEITICADSDSVTRVLINLIGNSLKFTKKGHIEVSLSDKASEVEISVADTGMGIAKDNMPKLFEKFQQFARVDGPGEKGTGLGLAIVRGIVDAHKGRIWAESEYGKGTKITFILPKKA